MFNYLEPKMPVSEECIKLLQNLVDNYEESGKEDKEYSLIYPLLKELMFLVVKHKNEHKDERIIGFLSSSALMLGENQFFAQECRLFLTGYQEKTHSLDSMLDRQLNIQPELDVTWGKQFESEKNSSSCYSPFFLELQAAIAKRAQRITANEKELE